jgi:hypothetical protein
MTGDIAPLGHEGAYALLRRAIHKTLIIGILASLVLWVASGWRNAGMMAAGTAISAASLYEWRRLVRFINAKLDKKQTSGSAAVSALFFVLRLTLFGGVIYVSLRCFRGSAIALLCGLGLAVLSLVWEALGLLRN